MQKTPTEFEKRRNLFSWNGKEVIRKDQIDRPSVQPYFIFGYKRNRPLMQNQVSRQHHKRMGAFNEQSYEFSIQLYHANETEIGIAATSHNLLKAIGFLLQHFNSIKWKKERIGTPKMFSLIRSFLDLLDSPAKRGRFQRRHTPRLGFSGGNPTAPWVFRVLNHVGPHHAMLPDE